MLDADGPVILPDHPAAGTRARLGLVSSLLAPLDGRRGPVGALGVHTRDPRVFTGDEVHFVQAVASVLIAAIERDEYAGELERMARHDALTGLPNRALFIERTREALARARRTGAPVAVLFADLDRFKVVNDSLGHTIGDRLLVEVAGRLRAAVRPFDTVARLSGDEFAVLCEDVPGAAEAVALAERVQSAMSVPFELGGTELFVTSSVGVVMGGSSDDEPETMLRDADAAMYRAKERGRARHELFDEEMRVEARLRLDLARDLRKALHRGQLRLVYQPSIDLRAGGARSVEALLRWDHPERGPVPPGEFIAMAEESGLIVPIGAWVLDEACRQAAAWQADGEDLTVAVNLSAHHFSRPELLDTVAEILSRRGVDPGRLVIEITESAVMADPEAAIATMDGLKDLGVGLAIDDFGTGYSSLSYLKRFPVDALKVDRSFVGGLGSDLQDRTIASAVVSLAHSLGLTAVAEGVETRRQLEELQALGCDSAQGFLWSRPVPPADLVGWLRSGAGAA
jgi:diguanylate cyclase (GGDEF)-like protein